MPDEPPGGEKIAVTVRRIHMGRLVGTSGMRDEHLKACIHEATLEKYLVTRRWETLVSITKVVFQEVHLL